MRHIKPIKHSSLVFVQLVVFCATPQLQADEAVIETILISERREEPSIIRLKSAPIASAVVDKDVLDKVKFTNPTELLDRLPGVSMSRNLRIPRGDKGYTIPLVDGFSLRNPYRGAVGQIEDTNIEDIERIEIIYGPGSALYGSNAFGGVVNVITMDPPEEQENKIWIEAGDHDRLRSGASTKGTIKSESLGDVGYTLDVSRWDIGGYRDDADEDRTSVSGKLVFWPSDNSKLWVRGEHLKRFSKTPGSLTQQQFDADEKQNPGLNSLNDSETTSASIGYIVNMENSQLQTGFSYRHDRGFDFAGFRDPNDFDLKDLGFKTEYRLDFGDNSGMPANVTSGLEVVFSTNDSVTFTDDTKSAIESDESIEMLVYAPFIQLEVMPIEKIKTTFGLRYEKVKYDVEDSFDSTRDQDRTFSAVSPKFGLGYDLTQDHALYAGVSKGFAPPSDSRMFQGKYENPDLDAEIANNFEIGVRGEFAESALSYDIAMYYLNIKDFIVNEYVETVKGRSQYRPVNAGKVNFKGLEMQLAYILTDYLSFDMSYTYARNKFIKYDDRGVDNSGNTLSSSPEHHANLRMNLIPADKFDIELEMDLISSYYTNNDNNADPDGRYSRDPLYNLRLNYEDGPYKTWLSILNLSDEKHATGVSYSTRGRGSRSYTVGDARSIYVGMSMSF